MKFLIVTGLSGAGKTSVLHHLEDSGYQCIDNLPPMLLSQVFSLFEHVEISAPVALGVDSRSGTLFNAEAVLDAVARGRESHDISILFVEADAEALIDRYKETRRDHPLMRGSLSLEEAIAREKALLQPLREQASYVLNSSGLRSRELCAQADELLSSGGGSRLRIEIMSFGYKRGIPRESDLVFDVRFLPNPFYIEELKRLTGEDAPVRDYVLGFPQTRTFLEKLTDMIEYLLPYYVAEGKNQLIIAIGCTGGQHRSVTLAAALYEALKDKGDYGLKLFHREQGRWSK